MSLVETVLRPSNPDDDFINGARRIWLIICRAREAFWRMCF